jgi:hypothetical protein
VETQSDIEAVRKADSDSTAMATGNAHSPAAKPVGDANPADRSINPLRAAREVLRAEGIQNRPLL